MKHLKGGYSQHPTRAFILRLWQEETGTDRYEWRGRLQSIADGEVRYFRTWATLVELLEVLLPNAKDREEPPELNIRPIEPHMETRRNIK
jgi:hypothetical protein